MRNTINNTTSVVGRTMDSLFQKFGYVRTVLLLEKDERINTLLERLSVLEEEVERLTEENKTYEELFNEMSVEQMGLRKTYVIQTPKKITNVPTRKRVLGMKTRTLVSESSKYVRDPNEPVHHYGPWDKSDKVQVPVQVKGHWRTYKSGLSVWVKPFQKNAWVIREDLAA